MPPAGVMVTASHNPMDYNGMKLVREESRPISGDSGLLALRDAAAAGLPAPAANQGRLLRDEDKSAYVEHLLGYIDRSRLAPLRIVSNPGNGGAGLVIDRLAPHLPFEFIRIQHEPDGRFPNGIPNPLLPECREATRAAVLAHGADFGLAWDGDFDRCFFFDHTGRFIEGYYLVGLLAEALLARHPGARIIHDPRLTWNTIEQVRAAGGVPIQSKTGHAFIKERMRAEDAVYGGEMSAHHYFRDFAYCDSGMIPWLLIAELVSRTGRTLADLVEARMAAYPCSGEINFKVPDVQAAIARIEAAYAPKAKAIDRTDGLSLEFEDWRFNLRGSNTEPVLRLNVEARGQQALLNDRVAALRAAIENPDAPAPAPRHETPCDGEARAATPAAQDASPPAQDMAADRSRPTEPDTPASPCPVAASLFDLPASMDDVVHAYRWILGREPESVAALQAHLSPTPPPRGELRRRLLRSAEFNTLLESLGYRRGMDCADTRPLAASTPRAVFIHVPKTGGTSLHHHLAQAFAHLARSATRGTTTCSIGRRWTLRASACSVVITINAAWPCFRATGMRWSPFFVGLSIV
ncbi:MAG: hypothetical protein KatS3mg122_3311 [Caldimonas sp.]|nr:MAG: hypothetical protein KatS3mg122_3311 [Caldimonas sp.]